MAPSSQLIGFSDNERDPEYVPLGTQTPAAPARVTRGTPEKLVPGVVTVCQSNEERILITTLSGSASGF